MITTGHAPEICHRHVTTYAEISVTVCIMMRMCRSVENPFGMTWQAGVILVFRLEAIPSARGMTVDTVKHIRLNAGAHLP